MRISNDTVAIIEYVVRDEKGRIIKNSRDSGPLSYIHGRGKIVPGLEKALEGKQPDDAISVTLSPAEGYGERDETLLHEFTREELAKLGELKAGMQLQAEGGSGKRILTVLSMDDGKVILDENHPMAGKTVRFDVHVLTVRMPTPEELESGQAYDAACRSDCSSCSSNASHPSDGSGCGCGCSH